MRNEVVVVGAGVAGLTCAVRLLEAGYAVRVVAAEFATDCGDVRTKADAPRPMCSPYAAAVWYPFAIDPPDKVAVWAKRSLWTYRKLRQRPESGVSIVPFELFFGKHDDIQESMMAECDPEPIPFSSEQYVAGIRIQVPFIETMVFLPFLEGRVRELGGTLERGTFGSLDELRGLGPVVVNCTGLGAKKLCNDGDLVPMRGQVLRVQAPSVNRWSLAIPRDGRPVYVIPRSGDCVLGGTEDDEKGDYRDWKIIEEACRVLEPSLDAGYTVMERTAGLRPKREGGVKLKPQPLGNGCTVIHNYGHGGAGFTVAWGCAEEVKELVDQAFESPSDPPATPA
jgi:D-amino-acid oxidase